MLTRALIAATWLVCVATMHAQQAGNASPTGLEIHRSGGHYHIQFDEVLGTSMPDFLRLAEQILQRPIEAIPEEVENTRVRVIGRQRVAVDKFARYVDAMLSAYEYELTDLGPQGLTVHKAPRSRSSLHTVSRAPVVDASDLAAYRDDRATLITTSIPLEHVEARHAASLLHGLIRTSVQATTDVGGDTNALVVTGFGRQAWQITRLARWVDLPRSAPPPVIVKRTLEHAEVDHTVAVLERLMKQRVRLVAASEALDVDLLKDTESNSLLIVGGSTAVVCIQCWIEILDVHMEPRSTTQVAPIRQRCRDGVLHAMLREGRFQCPCWDTYTPGWGWW